MTLMHLLVMNLIFDMAAVVFICFLCYRSRVHKNMFSDFEGKIKFNKELVAETIRNPRAAKRRLNKEK